MGLYGRGWRDGSIVMGVQWWGCSDRSQWYAYADGVQWGIHVEWQNGARWERIWTSCWSIWVEQQCEVGLKKGYGKEAQGYPVPGPCWVRGGLPPVTRVHPRASSLCFVHLQSSLHPKPLVAGSISISFKPKPSLRLRSSFILVSPAGFQQSSLGGQREPIKGLCLGGHSGHWSVLLMGTSRSKEVMSCGYSAS